MADDTATETAEETPQVDEMRAEVLAELEVALGDTLVESYIVPGLDMWIRVATASWQQAGEALHGAGFTYFSFLSAIDWMIAPEGRYEDTEFDDSSDDDAGIMKLQEGTGIAGGDARFQVFARVESPTRHIGVTVKADVGDDLTVATWSNLYPGADWHEREAWEMFGIVFGGHPGLRKLYLPGEFEGHPLRKTFPLLARVVKPWPGVVDIEDIPEHLEEQLEAEVMAAFEAENPPSETAS